MQEQAVYHEARVAKIKSQLENLQREQHRLENNIEDVKIKER